MSVALVVKESFQLWRVNQIPVVRECDAVGALRIQSGFSSKWEGQENALTFT